MEHVIGIGIAILILVIPTHTITFCRELVVPVEVFITVHATLYGYHKCWTKNTENIHWAKKEMSVFQEAVNISNIINIPLRLISKLGKMSIEPKKLSF